MTIKITEGSFEAKAEHKARPIHIGYRPDIDGLRAFAVLIVLFFHAFHEVLPGGFIGVDIFFVISGFLISSIIFKNMDRNSFSFVDFYVRRIKRIFPVLILVLATCYIYGWFEFFPAELMALGKHIAAGSVFGSNFALWQEAGYFDAASSTKPLLHLWSLAIEEQFYLIWPILALTVFRAKIGFFAVNLIIVVISFVVGVYLIDTDPTAAFYSPLSRFWEIGIGSALAWFLFKHEQRYREFSAYIKLDNILSVAGSAILLFSLIYFDASLKFPGYWAIIPTIGAALVILAGPNAVINRLILGSKPAVWVGLISYPVYLWHWPLLTAVHLSKEAAIIQNAVAAKLTVVVLSVLLGWLSYKLVEIPIRKIKMEKGAASVIFTVLLATGGIGLYTNQKDGLAYRIPESLRELAAITNVYSYFNFADAVRQNTCHFASKMQSDFKRPAECFSDKRPLLMIWGDSYAAALYPGIKMLSQSARFGIEQITVGNSPPFFDSNKLAADNKSLLEDNTIALEQAKATQPNVIVMSWMVTGMNGRLTPQDSVASFAETVSKVHTTTPNSKIVLIGPVPHWDNTLSQTVVNYLKNQPLGSKIAKYSNFGLRPEMKVWDDYFSTEIPKLGVIYVSAYKALCNENGCLTSVGPANTDLTAVDWGHLTKSGSEYLMKKVGSRIIDEMNKANL
jgi:peptidoglycan/LPS O-acetylase OafA/YrhL